MGILGLLKGVVNPDKITDKVANAIDELHLSPEEKRDYIAAQAELDYKTMEEVNDSKREITELELQKYKEENEHKEALETIAMNDRQDARENIRLLRQDKDAPFFVRYTDVIVIYFSVFWAIGYPTYISLYPPEKGNQSVIAQVVAMATGMIIPQIFNYLYGYFNRNDKKNQT